MPRAKKPITPEKRKLLLGLVRRGNFGLPRIARRLDVPYGNAKYLLTSRKIPPPKISISKLRKKIVLRELENGAAVDKIVDKWKVSKQMAQDILTTNPDIKARRAQVVTRGPKASKTDSRSKIERSAEWKNLSAELAKKPPHELIVEWTRAKEQERILKGKIEYARHSKWTKRSEEIEEFFAELSQIKALQAVLWPLLPSTIREADIATTAGNLVKIGTQMFDQEEREDRRRKRQKR